MRSLRIRSTSKHLDLETYFARHRLGLLGEVARGSEVARAGLERAGEVLTGRGRAAHNEPSLGRFAVGALHDQLHGADPNRRLRVLLILRTPELAEAPRRQERALGCGLRGDRGVERPRLDQDRQRLELARLRGAHRATSEAADRLCVPAVGIAHADERDPPRPVCQTGTGNHDVSGATAYILLCRPGGLPQTGGQRVRWGPLRVVHRHREQLRAVPVELVGGDQQGIHAHLLM